MIREVQSLLDRYWEWLRDQTVLREAGDWIEITTPYLDRHNDCLQIYAKRTGNGYVLTDDGYVLEDLEQSGYNINSVRQRSLIETTLNGFGIRISNMALEVRASADTFALRKHNLLQAMLAVDDISYLGPLSSSKQGLFHDDVLAWLDVSDIRYTPNVKLAGKSGYDHRFEFVIPKSNTHPERLLRAFNHANRNAALAMAFSWIDTKKARSPESSAYAILNDSGRRVPEGVLEAMRSYGVRTVLWSSRDEVRGELVA